MSQDEDFGFEDGDEELEELDDLIFPDEDESDEIDADLEDFELDEEDSYNESL